MKCEYCRGKGCENCMAKGGEVGSHAENHAYNEKETTHHVPVTGGISNNFGDAEYIVEHKSGSKKYFRGPEGSHESTKREAEEYRKRNLPKKYSNGGKVTGFDMNGPESKAFMEKGESTSEAEGGEIDGDDMDNELMDMCCDELLSAIEKKDKKEILESLKAIILSVGK